VHVYQLTKADESLLFEFEVRFRGACDEPTLLACMHTLRTELLEDFPAELFLTRPIVSSATAVFISCNVNIQVQLAVANVSTTRHRVISAMHIVEAVGYLLCCLQGNQARTLSSCYCPLLPLLCALNNRRWEGCYQ
jgi:hypothetical protein